MSFDMLDNLRVLGRMAYRRNGVFGVLNVAFAISCISVGFYMLMLWVLIKFANNI